MTTTERQFQSQILELAGVLGWRVYFTWKSLHSPAGFPDLLLLRGSRQVIAELKVAKREPTDDQRAWLDAFRAAGAEVFV